MKRRHRLPALLIVLFIAALLRCYPAVDYGAIKVAQVIDGDTVILANNQKVRYIGLDTPELTERTSTGFEYAPKPFAEEAREFNRSLVEGKVVRLEFDVVKKDKYGRLLAYCFVDDKLVNAEILKNGLGMLYTMAPNVKYVEVLVRAQEQARAEELNLWSRDGVFSFQEAGGHIGELATVEGRVLKVKKTNAAVYLNFGQDYRTDFSVVIFKDGYRLFNEKKIDLEQDFKGRMVRASGLIKEYNGPEIIVRHPAQIEVID
jgi:micrococcal nuclease